MQVSPFFKLIAAISESYIATLFVCLLVAEPANAVGVRIEWNRPTSASDGMPLGDLAGFRMHFGTSPARRDRKIDLANVTSHVIRGLEANTTYYITISAYDKSGNESPQSQLAEIAIPGLPRSGSGVAEPVTQCSGWNRFFETSWSFLEIRSRRLLPAEVQNKIYNETGILQQSWTQALPGFYQIDTSLPGNGEMTNASYGALCLTHLGFVSELRSRILKYALTPGLHPTDIGAFQYALAAPASEGKAGSQYLQINNINPSLAWSDRENSAITWVEIINMSEVDQTGTLTFYDLHGQPVSSQRLTLVPRGRRDVGTHETLPDQFGLVVWTPDDPLTKFLLFSTRYLFDNSYHFESFDGAFQIEALPASEETAYAPVDTLNRSTVLELANTSEHAQTLSVDIVGTTPRHVEVLVQPRASFHLLLNPLLGENSIGSVAVRSNDRLPFVAYAMHYDRSPDLGVNYFFGMPAKPLTGSNLEGSFNSHLGQTTWLVLTSPLSQPLEIQLHDAQGIPLGSTHLLASGTSAINLNNFTGPDRYGTVSILGPQPGSTIAWAIRSRPGEFAVPIAVE